MGNDITLKIPYSQDRPIVDTAKPENLFKLKCIAYLEPDDADDSTQYVIRRYPQEPYAGLGYIPSPYNINDSGHPVYNQLPIESCNAGLSSSPEYYVWPASSGQHVAQPAHIAAVDANNEKFGYELNCSVEAEQDNTGHIYVFFPAQFQKVPGVYSLSVESINLEQSYDAPKVDDDFYTGTWRFDNAFEIAEDSGLEGPVTLTEDNKTFSSTSTAS